MPSPVLMLPLVVNGEDLAAPPVARITARPGSCATDEHFVTKLVVDGGDGRGVAASRHPHGAVRAILGRAVILATGGAGKIFRSRPTATSRPATAWRSPTARACRSRTWSSSSITPWSAGTGILIHRATRGEGGHVKNSQGERFLVTRDYGVGTKAELGPRDIISRAIVQEIEAGRGFKGPYGDYVHLDLTHLGQKIIDRGSADGARGCRPCTRASIRSTSRSRSGPSCTT